jgi:Cu+-exporting ATPase
LNKGREVNLMEKDPVCGMDVSKKDAAATYEHMGKMYYFCAVECKNKFAENPEKFVKTVKA